MASEWWTSPSEAQRRLDALTTLWNGVQNAALGRGVKPIVSAALADHIVAENQAYREFREAVEGWTFGVQFADELTDWQRRANAARDAVAKEIAALGKSGTVKIPAKVTEWEATAIPTVFAGGAGIVLALGAIALFFWAGKGSGGGGGEAL